MSFVVLAEYALTLSTGERIEVSELDPGALEGSWSAAAEAEVRQMLDLCSTVPREVIEEAKLGYDTRLKQLLRDPVGALIRLDRPVCSMISDCPMADRRRCDTRNSGKKGSELPLCWEYATDPGLDDEVRASAAAIAFAVVHALRRRRHVLFVRG